MHLTSYTDVCMILSRKELVHACKDVLCCLDEQLVDAVTNHISFYILRTATYSDLQETVCYLDQRLSNTGHIQRRIMSLSKVSSVYDMSDLVS